MLVVVVLVVVVEIVVVTLVVVVVGIVVVVVEALVVVRPVVGGGLEVTCVVVELTVVFWLVTLVTEKFKCVNTSNSLKCAGNSFSTICKY